LERAVRAVAEQAQKANAIVDKPRTLASTDQIPSRFKRRCFAESC
jgi:hypothetical protein